MLFCRILFDQQSTLLIRESKFDIGFDENCCIRVKSQHSLAGKAGMLGLPLIPRWVGLTIPPLSTEQREPLGKVLSHGAAVEYLRVGGYTRLPGDNYAGS